MTGFKTETGDEEFWADHAEDYDEISGTKLVREKRDERPTFRRLKALMDELPNVEIPGMINN